MKQHPLLFLLVAGLFSAALLISWLYLPRGLDQSHASQAALAEYDLQKVTCGSCVSKITAALDDLAGVDTIEIDLTSSRGRITFDPAATSADQIARTIRRAGYPAALRTELDSAELAALHAEESRLVRTYVARVGDRFVTRSDFESRVDQAGGNNAASPPAETAATRLAVWQEILQRELLLNAAARNGVVVLAGEVEIRLQELRQRHGGERELMPPADDEEILRQRLREDMIIQRNLEDHVLAGVSEPGQRRSLLQDWFKDLNRRTEVAIFDPELRSMTSAKAGGCGGSCCG